MAMGGCTAVICPIRPISPISPIIPIYYQPRNRKSGKNIATYNKNLYLYTEKTLYRELVKNKTLL